MYLYDDLKKNVLSISGVNDMLNRIKYMMIRAEEIKDDMEERMKKYNNFLYLFFLAPNNPESDACVMDLASNLGLEMEEHTVKTEDGYILQVHRIPGDGPPVLLQHGLMCTSACWLTSGDQSLAYLLSKAGYDVWMGNIRGNRYGSEHESLETDQSDFWRFTFHHFGKYDIPAIIDKVLSVSKYEKLNYIGHSMGSTSALVTASTSQRIVPKLNVVVLLAPVAAGQTVPENIRKLASLHRHQRMVFEWMGITYLPPKVPYLKSVTARPLFPLVSDMIFKMCAGFIDGYTGEENIIQYLPSTVSLYTVLHFSQNINERRFGAYDWGSREENLEHYNEPLPPQYILERLTAPTAVFTATHDTLSPPSELEIYEKQLPNLVEAREVELSHLGFLWGQHAKDRVYKPILDLFRTYPMTA